MFARRLFLIVFGAGVAAAVMIATELLLALFGVAEADPVQVVRFDQGEPTSPRLMIWDRDLLYRLSPSSDFLGYYRTNDRGYRGAPFPTPTPDGFRVVCIGDSCTFGLGVPEEAAWPGQLEAALEALLEGVATVQVMNLGIPGYSTLQNRRQIETELQDLDPDAVVYLPTGYNDANRSQGATDAERAAIHRGLRTRLARTRIARLLGAEDPEAPYSKGVGLASLDEHPSPRVPIAQMALELDRAASVCADLGVPLILIAPVLSDELYAMDASLEARGQLVRDRDAFDPRGDFGAASPWPLFLDLLHPTQIGHTLIARAALNGLVARFTSGHQERPYPRAAVLDRFRFWSALSAARVTGLPATGTPEWLLHAPPSVRAWITNLAQGDIDERLRAGDPKLDARLRAFDPVAGAAGPDPAALWLQAKMNSGTTDPEARAAAWIRMIRETPPGPFRQLLLGAGPEPGPEDPDRADQPPEPIAGPTPSRPDRSALAVARALTVFIESTGLRGPHADRGVLAAMSLRSLGDGEGALAASEEALSFRPQSPEALYQRILARNLLNQHEAAMAEALQLSEAHPEDPRFQSLVGMMFARRGRRVEARPYLERALQGDPVDPEAMSALGRILLDAREFDGAERMLYTAYALNKLRDPDIPRLLKVIQDLRKAEETGFRR